VIVTIIQFLVTSVLIIGLGFIKLDYWLIGLIVSVVVATISLVSRRWQLTPPPHGLEEENHESEFSRSGERISESASRIAIGGASVSHFLDKLTQMFTQQVASVKEIAERIQSLEKGNEELITFAATGQEKIQDSDEKTQHSNQLLAQLLEKQSTLSLQIEEAKQLLETLRTSADSIASITITINQLADQTNMLALNAAIEAARAGEQGRGFAVVADEVRNLAKKTSDATQGIDDVLSDINRYSQASVESIARVSDAGKDMSVMISETSTLIQQTSESSSEAAEAMARVRDTVNLHGENNRGISVNAMQLHKNTQNLEVELSDVSEKVLTLSHQTEDIFRQLIIFNLHDRNTQVQQIAQQAASQIGEIFAQGLTSGAISQQALFDVNYRKIPNTHPQKYSTGFDTFTDKVLPDIQEPILQQNSFIVYAGAVDKNGYFPTHNRKFSAPLSGNYERDLAYSRTKRIFDDYTGIRCGKSTESFLLQTYKRDTGEVMHDLSAPIYVNGKHWGGFRIGYQSQSETQS
jgi:methyl-accepting chemotaxis protein